MAALLRLLDRIIARLASSYERLAPEEPVAAQKVKAAGSERKQQGD